jgi:acyl carrier protein
VSSLIDASEILGHEAQNGECEQGIIHFDATQRRKDKMRQKSQETPKQGEHEPKPEALPPAKTMPTVCETNIRPASEPAKKSATNGAATLAGYTTSTVKPSASAQPSLGQLSEQELQTFLIDFVVEQTGYPPEMVDLDADLEADLGIDSIKKAQLFGELAERFSIAVDVADESLSLDDFPTLKHVMQFLQSQSAGPKKEAPAPAVAPQAAVPASTPVAQKPEAHRNGSHAEPKPAPVPAAQTSALAGMDLEKFLVDFVVEQTGYPPEMVELDADLEADLGIDSIKKAQLFGELAEQFSISVDVTDENLSLDDFPTLRHVMNFLSAKGSASSAAVESKPSPSPVAVPKPQETPRPVSTPQAQAARPSANGTGHAHKEPEASQASALSQEQLENFLVNFVVEQTGYPPEMVELDADLEADLGIDSIKKAQMMGELAEQFSISVDVTDEDLSLDDFPTLRHVCNFLAGPAKAAV